MAIASLPVANIDVGLELPVRGFFSRLRGFFSFSRLITLMGGISRFTRPSGCGLMNPAWSPDAW